MKFETILKLKQKALKSALMSELKSYGYKVINKNGFLFAQGSEPVLLVAHLDTVHKDAVRDICYSKDGNIVMSPQGIGGDDRCGVFMILEIIKSKKCSVVFCEDEEVGCIGAKLFCKSNIKVHNINYIIEFDRVGSDDAVFYDCENEEFTDFVLECGFVEAFGSFSDISEIAPHLKKAAVNISSGYYNPHTRHEYIDLKVVKNNIYKVLKLIAKKCNSSFQYIERKKSYCLNDYDYFETYYKDLDSIVEELTLEGYEVALKELMLLDGRDGYVEFEGVVFELDYGEDFYMDDCSRVYYYDYTNGVCEPCPNAVAMSHFGGCMTFNHKMAVEMVVVL